MPDDFSALQMTPRMKDAGVTNMEAKVASAIDLSQFADNSFDAVTMQYVLMSPGALPPGMWRSASDQL